MYFIFKDKSQTYDTFIKWRRIGLMQEVISLNNFALPFNFRFLHNIKNISFEIFFNVKIIYGFSGSSDPFHV